jgi:hypothetical protein
MAENMELGDDEFDDIPCELDAQGMRQFEKALLEVSVPLTHDVVREKEKEESAQVPPGACNDVIHVTLPERQNQHTTSYAGKSESTFHQGLLILGEISEGDEDELFLSM